MIHFNRHFYIFGLLVRLFLRIHGIWTIVYDVIFFWYTILHFNHNIKCKERPSYSTQSRDQQYVQTLINRYCLNHSYQLQKLSELPDNKSTFCGAATLIHFNRHFYIFGLLVRLFLRIHGIWTIVYDVIFFWYTILHFNHNIKCKERPSYSTQSRDQQYIQTLINRYCLNHSYQLQKLSELPDNKSTFCGAATLMRFPLLLLLLATSLIFHRTLSICLCILLIHMSC